MEENNKRQEPFDPKQTPRPPHVQDPTGRINEEDIKEESPDPEKDKQREPEEKKKEKKLGESPIEIDDETTI